MGAYVVVIFLEPLPAGFTFERSSWPLHITLARFDTPEPAGAVAARIGPGLDAGLAAGTAGTAEVTGAAEAAGPGFAGPGFTVRIGADERFGRHGSVPVSLVEPEPRLLTLHTGVLDALDPRARVAGVGHTRSGFRPHVSHQRVRLHPGDEVRLRQAALVDMRPGGDSRFRTVLAVWGDSGYDRDVSSGG